MERQVRGGDIMIEIDSAIDALIEMAIAEDLAGGVDITSVATIGATTGE